MTKRAIFKIGGSVLKDSESVNNVISQFHELMMQKILDLIIIVPGGGIFANFIRYADKKLKLGDDPSHWLAILAMNYNGMSLIKKYDKIFLTEDFDELKEFEKGIILFLPFKYLYNNDVLPHSWDVTSDSITLYFANKLNLKSCYLIKDVNGIYGNKGVLIKEITPQELMNLKDNTLLLKNDITMDIVKNSSPIDSHSLKMINEYHISCTLLNGTEDEIILKYFKSSDKKIIPHTKITPK
ncbi:MAG: amino acid kinase family protein [Promethearchaeota archaeon]